MPYWLGENQSYQNTTGLTFELMNSGYLTIAPSNDATETIDVPFVWWLPSDGGYDPGINWWDDLEIPTDSSSLDTLDFVNFDLYGADDEYFLVLPELKNNAFRELDGDWLISDGYDPTVDNSIFEQMLTEDYQFVSVKEEDVSIEDLVNYPVSPLPPNDTIPTPVPEPSSVVSTLVLGTVFVGTVVKRTFFSKTKAKTA